MYEAASKRSREGGVSRSRTGDVKGVTKMGSDDDVDPEVAYWRQRAIETRRDLDELNKIIHLHIDNTVVGECLDHVVAVLETEGNGTLANMYKAAYLRFIAFSGALQRATAAGQVDAAGRDEMNDALEEFERIEAEVFVWLDKQGGT
jgi:hypothetical protein